MIYLFFFFFFFYKIGSRVLFLGVGWGGFPPEVMN